MLFPCFPSVVRGPGSPHSPKKLCVKEPAPKLTRPLLSSKGRCIFHTRERGVEQGGKSPFSLLSEPISPSSLLFEPISPSLKFNFFFSLLPTFSPYFSVLPSFLGPFLPPPYSVPLPSRDGIAFSLHSISFPGLVQFLKWSLATICEKINRIGSNLPFAVKRVA